MNQAKILLRARLETGLIEQFPTPRPVSLKEAYDIQDAIIDGWPDQISGWKVGRILGQAAIDLGCDRLAGPIFQSTVHTAHADGVDMPVFAQGFAAVEGECVAVINQDTPLDKVSYTTDEAIAVIGSMHLGVEIASSPFPGINDNGPLVTISDLGNNYGLIVGDEIPDWKDLRLQDWAMATFIDGKCVGEANPSIIPGGPVESVRFLLENCASRGRPLKKGDLVSTGAVTGVHLIKVGQGATVTLNGAGEIRCRIIPRTF